MAMFQENGFDFLRLLVEDFTRVEETFTFQNSPETWVFYLLILPAAVFFSALLYRMEAHRVSARTRTALIVLRSLVILLVVLCLFRPVLLTQRVREVKPVSLMLLDNSASMREHDLYAELPVREQLAGAAGLSSPEQLREETRQSLVARVLEQPRTGWLAKLESRYDMKYYGFDAAVSPLGGVHDLNSEGNSTRLGDALSEVVKEYRGRRLSNIIVVSDGRSNRGREPGESAAMAAAEQIPVHTIGVGDPTVSRNIEIVSVTAPSVVLVNDEVIFKVHLSSRGFEGRPVTLMLKNRRDGAILAAKDAELKGEEIDRGYIESIFGISRGTDGKGIETLVNGAPMHIGPGENFGASIKFPSVAMVPESDFRI
ncbi:MAG: VWA domain-containing protein, partial [Planctomycetes bacterium]|nr:VWA domain-containing protein [Planctomycetota bacterium]